MANPVDVVANAFEEFRPLISADEALSVGTMNLEDIRSAIRYIDGEVKAAHDLRRIEPFLRGIEKFATAMEILCNGTPYLPYIWAPIKLMLEVTSSSQDAFFDFLLSAYADVGAALPRFDNCQPAVINNRGFQYALAAVYSTLLEFHRHTYILCKQRNRHQRNRHSMSLSMRKTFKLELDPIINSLEEKKKIMDNMSVAASSGVELRGEGDQEPEPRRNQQRHLHSPAQALSAEPRPFHHFEAVEPETGMNESTSVRRKCKGCFVLYLMWGAVVIGSLIIGLWRSFVTGDEGKGFTDAAYVVAVGGIIVFPVQNRHRNRCKALSKTDD